jgi:hypothetical protein
MYKQYLEILPCKTGKGVFTTVQIPANVPVLEITGPILVESAIPANAPIDDYLQIGPNTFIGLSGGLDDYLNHSCDPNCKMHVVGNRAFMYSLYVIPKNAQLTFDYSTTSTDTLETWKMNCQCGSFKCRKVISGNQYLPPALRQTYVEKGMLPMYITRPNLIQKK